MSRLTTPVLAAVLLAAAAPALPEDISAAPDTPAHANAARWAMFETYCTECHNTTDWAGGVAYDALGPDDVPDDINVWEATIRKLRGHLMPPPGSAQPTQHDKDAMVGWLETRLDARQETPRAGHVTAQRLSRTEYANAVRSLLGVEIKVEDLLPPEIEMDGFDNIAAALTLSPTFLEQYIGAARFVSKRAVGDPKAQPGKTQHLPADSADRAMPPGSAGGMRFTHFFPADGEYRLSFLDDLTGGLYTGPLTQRRTIVVLVDGREVFRGDIGGKEDLGLADSLAAEGREQVMARFRNLPFKAESGAREVVVTALERSRALPEEWSAGGFGGPMGAGAGLRLSSGVEVAGPFAAEGVGRSPSRDRIFVCTPTGETDEADCAARIARHLATQAYRRPATDRDVARLMKFYTLGRKEIGTFDGGVQEIVMAVLASPDFLYRTIAPRGAGPQPLAPLELASRLSFFLWGDVPDDKLRQAAVDGSLPDPEVYERQVRRMLADRRAQSLVTGFAMRWLNVDDLKAVDPDRRIFPAFNEALRGDFSSEIQLFLADVLLQDRGVLELLSADYSFLNERLARHYGQQGVFGSQFRRVHLDDDNRHGLLGKAAVLLRTSYGDRTSPVLRGAWVLERIMGTPATPPPPGVETNLSEEEGAVPTTLRARLEVHRSAQACNQCHGVIDPIGLAMENFDAIGAWRTKDNGFPVDASTVLPNGQAIDGASQLRAVLLERPEQFAESVTERLLMYATGRAVGPADMPQVRQIVHAARAGNYRFFDLVMGVAKSDAFRLQGPPPETAGAAMTAAAMRHGTPERE